jgi:hypothetical protein
MTLLRILHALTTESRTTTKDYVFSFSDHADNTDVECVNIHCQLYPSDEIQIADLTIVTYELLSLRSANFWPQIELGLESWFSKSRKNILMPQDDYTDTRSIEKLVEGGWISAIYSAVNSDLKILYPTASKMTRIEQCLTGYVSEARGYGNNSNWLPFNSRGIDLGNRVTKLPIFFGYESLMKYNVTKIVADAAHKAGLVVDVEYDSKSVFMGDAWFSFMKNTCFTVGAKGGAYIVDPLGNVRQRFDRQIKKSPDNEEKALRYALKAKHRVGNFSAVGPRIFEFAQHGVCQILIEDNYLPNFVAGEDYFALKSDFSNLREAITFMKNKKAGERMAENAFANLISSGLYTYRKFVKDLLDRELPNRRGSTRKFFIGNESIDKLFHFSPEMTYELLGFIRKDSLGFNILRSKKKPNLIKSMVSSYFDTTNEINYSKFTLDEITDCVYKTMNQLDKGNTSYLGFFIPTVTSKDEPNVKVILKKS